MGKKPTDEELEQQIKALEKETAKRLSAESALQESEARYRQITSSIPGVVYQFLLKKDGSYSSPYISESAGTILDISAEEIMADPYALFNMIVEEDLNSVNQSIAESAHTMKTWLQEFRIRDNAGKIRWIRATSTPRSLPGGEVLWDGVLLDISSHVQAEEVLQRAHDELEELVEKRTAKLKKANERLKQEIKEHKQTEKALIQAKEEWEQTFETVPDAIMLLERPFRITRVNKSMADLLGLTPDECVGQTCYRVVHGTDEPPSFCPHKKLLDDGQEHTEEFREEHLGGYFIVSASPIYDTKGKLTGSVHVARNITERKQAEDALLIKDNALATSINAVALADLEGKLTYVNRSFCNLWGYDNEKEILGREVSEFWQPEEAGPLLKKSMTKTGGWQGEGKATRKNGSEFYVQLSSSLVTNKTGRRICLMAAFIDITTRKQAEEELQKIFEKLKDLESIINRSPAMVFLWPVHEGWPVEFVTDNVKQTLGYTADDFISGKVSWPGITHPEDVPRLEAEVAKYLEEGTAEFNQEYRLITKSGDIRWMRDRNKVLFDSTGTPTHIQSIVLDVTERKAAEEQWRFQSEIAINVSEGISLIRTSDYTIVYANPKFEEIFGYDPNELTGQHISIVNAPTDKSPEEKAEEVANSLKNNGYWKGEIRNIKKDGTPFWCYASVSVFNHYKYGEVFVSVHQDITERKNVEKELVKYRQHLEELAEEQTAELIKVNKNLKEEINERKQTMETLQYSEERFRAVFEQAGNSIVVLDGETGEVLEFNDQAHNNLGYTREEFSKLTIADIEVIESRDKIIKHRKKVQDIRADIFETKHRTKQGDIRDVIVNVRRVRAHNKDLLVSIWQDITERKKAEEELIKREAELKIKTSNLEEVNTALKIMLKKKDEVKTEIEEEVLSNVKELVVPYVEKLKKGRLNEEQHSYLNILELNLNNITSSFSHKLSSKYIKLTPTELRVANLIKYGNNTKEIAEQLSLSRTTIDFHRQNIRKKLGIRNKKTNLRTYLLSFSE